MGLHFFLVLEPRQWTLEIDLQKGGCTTLYIYLLIIVGKKETKELLTFFQTDLDSSGKPFDNRCIQVLANFDRSGLTLYDIHFMCGLNFLHYTFLLHL